MITALIRLCVISAILFVAILAHLAIGRQMFFDEDIPGLQYKPGCCPCDQYIEEEEPSYG